MSLTELADRVGVTIANLSILKTVQGSRGAVLDPGRPLCRELQCQPGDILVFTEGPPDEEDGENAD